MCAQPILEVRGMSKKYCRDLKRSLMYGVTDLGKELIGLGGTSPRLRKKEFWALKDIDFSLEPGDSLGLIGLNGAGKTTLLKILNGLIKPSLGEVVVRGSMGALIALGAGFNPVLTGRENIYLNGAILGIPTAETRRQFDEIVDFAELEEFLDTPVQSYSSGMKVRLGFAVAVCLRPQILLLDEVLAVGDIAFARKSLEKVTALLQSGLTVIFVSHAIRQVEQICKKALLLQKGRIIEQGPTDQVTQTYYRLVNQKSLGVAGDQDIPLVRGVHCCPQEFQITAVECLDDQGRPGDDFLIGQDVTVRVRYQALRPIKDLRLGLQIQTVDGVYLASMSSPEHGLPSSVEGPGYVDCLLPGLPLREGAYHLLLNVYEGQSPLFKSDRTRGFSVLPDDYWYHQAGSRVGLVVLQSQWSQRDC